jgi:hypothetical protein
MLTATLSVFGMQNFVEVAGMQKEQRTRLPPFYHTTSQLGLMVKAMQNTCAGFTVETASEDGTPADLSEDPGALSLQTVRIKQSGGAAKKLRVALVFNEHARELITGEVALWLMRQLCQSKGTASLIRQEGVSSLEASLLQSNVTAALSDMEFLLVPNANPSSRMKVENGDYCLRANENGVDLNRDWDEHWQSSAEVSDAPPGSAPFSQPETRILKKILGDFKPELFISVHSGNLGVFVPWAYAKTAPAPAKADLSLAEGIAKDFCKCPFGGAAQTVGYPCPGTSLDYVYDKLGARYSFAVEIWISRDQQPKFKSRFEALEKQWRSQHPSSLSAQAADAEMASTVTRQHEMGSARMAVHAGGHAGLLQGTLRRHEHHHHLSKFDPSWCLQNFNPLTETDFKDTRQRWTHALLALANRVKAQQVH